MWLQKSCKSTLLLGGCFWQFHCLVLYCSLSYNFRPLNLVSDYLILCYGDFENELKHKLYDEKNENIGKNEDESIKFSFYFELAALICDVTCSKLQRDGEIWSSTIFSDGHTLIKCWSQFFNQQCFKQLSLFCTNYLIIYNF